MVKEMPQDYLQNQILNLVSKTFFTLGQQSSDENLVLISTEVTRDVMKDFYMLSLQEIEIAFGEGVRGKYGDFYGLNIVTFNKWMQFYLDSGKHYQYIMVTNKDQKQLQQKTEPTDEEKENILKSGVLRCYNQWKETGEIIDYGNPIFHYLYDKGEIEIDDKAWFNYCLNAKNTITAEIKAKAVSIDKMERLTAKAILRDESLESQILSLAKKLVLADYFKIK